LFEDAIVVEGLNNLTVEAFIEAAT